MTIKEEYEVFSQLPIWNVDILTFAIANKKTLREKKNGAFDCLVIRDHELGLKLAELKQKLSKTKVTLQFQIIIDYDNAHACVFNFYVENSKLLNVIQFDSANMNIPISPKKDVSQYVHEYFPSTVFYKINLALQYDAVNCYAFSFELAKQFSKFDSQNLISTFTSSHLTPVRENAFKLNPSYFMDNPAAEFAWMLRYIQNPLKGDTLTPLQNVYANNHSKKFKEIINEKLVDRMIYSRSQKVVVKRACNNLIDEKIVTTKNRVNDLVANTSESELEKLLEKRAAFTCLTNNSSAKNPASENYFTAASKKFFSFFSKNTSSATEPLNVEQLTITGSPPIK
ncbi:MAG: hypothetical protein Tsb005_08340 [Gammaproteobacteria bacterium]